MAFGALIIGDEILSGRRVDKHFSRLVEVLDARGLRLSWARFVGDEPGRLVETLRESFATGDVVFSFGGIGATPDDLTRQAAAAALGVELALHPEAEAILRAKFGTEITDHRLQMGVFPIGSELVPNPYNQIPGFSIREHHFVPGFPVMAWPMIEAVLDSRFAHLFHREQRAERSFLVYGLAESTATPLMEQVERSYPGVRVFSLPSMGEDGVRRHIELGVRGPVSMVDEACARLEAGARELGGELR